MTLQLSTPQLTRQDALTTLRRRYIQICALLPLTASLISLARLFNGETSGGIGAVAPTIAESGVVLLVSVLILFLVRRGNLRGAGTLLILVLAIPTPFALNSPFFVPLALFTLISAATLGNWLLYMATNIMVIGFEIGAVINVQFNVSPISGYKTTTIQEIGILVGLIVVSLVTRYFTRAAETFAQNARRSSNLLQAAADIGQITSKILDLNQLLSQAVDLIRDRFAFYHVQVFLLNEERDFAVLVASTGDVGQQLLARQHKLGTGSQSVIGRVTQIGEPVIVSDTDTDTIWARNELLPYTRSELALPILDGERIIGALDVQSTRQNAFNIIDVQALQVMANQLGTTIRNARLFEAQARSVQENKRLFLESEANLRENQRLNRQLTKTAWTNYLKENHNAAGIRLTEDALVPDTDWSDPMIQASQRRRPIAVYPNADKAVIAVPIVLRGEVLGAVEVESGGEMREHDTVELVQAIAQRLAVSLDRARLFEEAQETTAQEQHINSIVARYQTAGTVDDLLRITLTELSESLGAQRGAIRLGNFRAQLNGQQNGDATDV